MAAAYGSPVRSTKVGPLGAAVVVVVAGGAVVLVVGVAVVVVAGGAAVVVAGGGVVVVVVVGGAVVAVVEVVPTVVVVDGRGRRGGPRADPGVDHFEVAPLSCEMAWSTSSFHRGSGAPERYQGPPLSATNMPYVLSA